MKENKINLFLIHIYLCIIWNYHKHTFVLFCVIKKKKNHKEKFLQDNIPI